MKPEMPRKNLELKPFHLVIMLNIFGFFLGISECDEGPKIAVGLFAFSTVCSVAVTIDRRETFFHKVTSGVFLAFSTLMIWGIIKW